MVDNVPSNSQLSFSPISAPTPQPNPLTAQHLEPTSSLPLNLKVSYSLTILVAAWYLLKGVIIWAAIFILQRAMNSGDLIFNLLKYYPTLGFIPIIFFLITFGLFFVALKMRTAAKSNYWLVLANLTLLPAMATLLGQFAYQKFLLQTENAAASGSNLPIPTLSQNPVGLFLPVILVWVAATLFGISIKNMSSVGTAQSKSAKIFLGLLAIILLTLTFWLVTLYYGVNNEDVGYSRAQGQVSFHIYRPSYMPTGKDYATKFTLGNELGGISNAVKFSLNTSFDLMLKGEHASPVVINQAPVDREFDLEAFSSSLVTGVTPVQVVVTNAREQHGFALHKRLEHMELYTLVFITNDDVLIAITSPNTTMVELQDLAESLE